MEVSDYHCIAVGDMENQFATHLEKGLTPAEAAERLEKVWAQRTH